jgi:hypothetical protein
MKRLIILFSFILLAYAPEIKAQCTVCRISAESNIDGKENDKGKGLNTGILYLMSVPYLMGGVAGYIWWKNRKK